MTLAKHKKSALILIALSLVSSVVWFFGKGNKYSGYIDADMTYLSGSYPGRLAELTVKRGEKVEKGQQLFKLDQSYEDFDSKIDTANIQALQADRQQILDQLTYAERFYKRQKTMGKDQAASTDDIESARKNVEVLQGKIKSIDAAITAANARSGKTLWQLYQKDGIAPDDGLVFDTYKTIGEYSQTGQPVLSLITAPMIKVVFYLPEKKLSKLKIGQEVTIEMDGASEPLQAHVDYISNKAEYTPPIIFSREERQKLVFKIVAKIDSPNLSALHLGQPVSVSIKND